ncbi:hypothetical protein LCGC14_1394150 [marine sediment metagenome]|uniref:Uncharacterized protein n=1 Tax=marine sediment metagenome TaxID=412755 RepID=A0A0F9KJX3_9ZZZZ
MVWPNSVTKKKGSLIEGDITSFYTAEGLNQYKVKGSGWMIYKIDFYVDYPNNPPSGDDPYVDMKFYFSGEGTVKITVSYYDGTSDSFTYSESEIWNLKPLDTGKTISRKRWENTEWWIKGQVWVDVAVIYYI